jgi:hypothetical protein
MSDKPGASPVDRPVHLAYAPTNPREFNTLAIQIAERLRDTPLPDSSATASPIAVLPSDSASAGNGKNAGLHVEGDEEVEEDHERL